jgi:hypothetical protein
MSQHYPNFTCATPRAGQPAPVQTKRVAFTGSGSAQQVDLTWDAAFADTNYTVSYSIEVAAGNAITNQGTFTKTASGISVVDIVATFGFSYVLHAVAYHD